jgi:hypothetical protein
MIALSVCCVTTAAGCGVGSGLALCVSPLGEKGMVMSIAAASFRGITFVSLRSRAPSPVAARFGGRSAMVPAPRAPGAGGAGGAARSRRRRAEAGCVC